MGINGRFANHVYFYCSNSSDIWGHSNLIYGLRLLITIDGVEYDVFNKIYDTAYYKYNEGDLVPVKMNPNDPTEYYVNEGTSQGMFLYLLGVGMIAFGAIMIKYFWF